MAWGEYFLYFFCEFFWIRSLLRSLLDSIILLLLIKYFCITYYISTAHFLIHPQHHNSTTKGQYISELIYEVIVSPKIWTQNCKDFCPVVWHSTGQKFLLFFIKSNFSSFASHSRERKKFSRTETNLKKSRHCITIK